MVDKAVVETINGVCQLRQSNGGGWQTIKAVEFVTLEWLDWFNHRWLLEPIGNIAPQEAEANFYAALEQPARAA